ncbi:NaeI family type II restriction endonuclease [Streptomyces antarcticus]|uniref:NaeI family type II restriction endonuclease n=1 Tax=Streptomyces antarcticus TaxID=2996458 RepID=UPI00226EED28|nr:MULTISPECIES: NaeI family type II restriction endonuclease [unclassified Streptomyces]MCY0942020.1 NaeI family type II restriction endonuclease [Streptomyces sp. H34-AA3]MCZ4081962.1 NaeI family type II restriction endonuclease [Streptomyces sp. H34-S5]
MTSDPAQPSSPSELRRLLEVLDRAGGHGATPTELAELIWLARHRGTPEHAAQVGSEEPVREGSASARGEAPESAVPGDGPEPPQEPGRPGLPLSHRSDTEPSDDGPYASLLAPLPPMLAHPLPLQRALRPLRRRVPSRLETDLDERNTAYGIARQGAWPGTWLPVLRARPEWWLTLYLAYDAGPTMPIWRPLLQELRRVIGQTGAFRGIQLLELTRHGRLRQSPGGRPAVLPPRDGRAVALILSDCSGPAWYAGSEAAADWYRTLGRWSRRMPVAVVQPLPERLWRRTALPGSAGLLTARGLAAPNSGLRFAPYDGPGEGRPAGASLPLPLLEPSARWFAHWARLVAGPPGTTVPGVVATLPTASSAVPLDLGASSPQDLSPEEQVLNFHAHASPQALRLAAHLAVGEEPGLPMMRLVQAATEARPEPQHLAEVILSGLLTTDHGTHSASGRYTFRPGVREVLLRTLPRSTAARIDTVIRHHAGSRPGELPVAVPAEDAGGARGRGRPHGEPLAVVTEETVQRLGRGPDTPADGPGATVGRRYRLVQRQHSRAAFDIWRATDNQLDKDVVLKLFRVRMASQAGRQRFLADAERLAALGIRGLVRIGDFGFHDDRPFLVTDPVEGEDFGQLLRSAPGNMTLEAITAIGGQIAGTLKELHLNGLLHLDLSPAALVVRPDGRVLITDPGLGVHGLVSNGHGGFQQTVRDLDAPSPPCGSPEQLFGPGADHRSDLYSLGCLLYAMATGAPPALGARVLRNAWMHGPPHPHPRFRSGFSPEFDALVGELLAADPKYRPPRADDVLDRLMGMGAGDAQLTAVADAVLAMDPHGIRMGRLLRDAIDAVLDGPRTGRYDWKTLFKTEKTYFGTQVEISIQREFEFPDGTAMDYRIAGVDVDCKYSQQFGGWMFPPEATGHLCLLVWADDHQGRWSAGLVRIREEWRNAASNRDLKFTIKAEHRDKIFWLWHQAELPENILLHMSDADREAVLGKTSGQDRLNELFRRVQQRRIGRNTVRSVVRQKDYMKRVRGNGGSRSVLRSEGIIIMGDYRAHQDIARQLGLPVPQKGEFVSARVVPAVPGSGKPAAAMDGGLWSLASPGDDVVTAPILPSTSTSGGA